MSIADKGFEELNAPEVGRVLGGPRVMRRHGALTGPQQRKHGHSWCRVQYKDCDSQCLINLTTDCRQLSPMGRVPAGLGQPSDPRSYMARQMRWSDPVKSCQRAA